MKKQKINRVIVIVLDGVGVGAAPDASAYGDVGSNSIGNVAQVLGGIDLPNMGKLGLGNVIDVNGVPPTASPLGGYGKMQPKSAGKDTITGHWEIMGVHLDTPFPTYPDGFPLEIIKPFENYIGKSILANCPASGTAIIQQYGSEHMRTGQPIVYTSADSVFQIAAHEEIVPLEKLYDICEYSRKILCGKHAVGRVIARPFIGDPTKGFERTKNRKDYARTPDTPTAMDQLIDNNLDVWTVGKIDDIFVNRGISRSNHTVSNQESIDAMLEMLEQNFRGLLFVNLIEFDMIYGHRNDPRGYAGALKQFDDAIPEIRVRMKPDDILIITADHGVDPTTESTDHSREYVPLLVTGDAVTSVALGIRKTFGDIAATILDVFSISAIGSDLTSFLNELQNSHLI